MMGRNIPRRILAAFSLIFLLAMGLAVRGSAAQEATVIARPAFLDAWFGDDFPLDKGCPVPLPVQAGQRGGASGLTLTPFVGSPGGGPSLELGMGMKFTEHPGVASLDFRACLVQPYPGTHFFFLNVEYDAIDFPRIVLQKTSSTKRALSRTFLPFFTGAGSQINRRNAWFLLADEIRLAPHENLIVLGEAGCRLLHIELWPFPRMSQDALRSTLIRRAYQRTLKRNPSPREFELSMNSNLTWEWLYHRLMMGDEFRHRFIDGRSRTRVAQQIHHLFHAGEILQSRVFGFRNAWRRGGFDKALFYLFMLEQSVLENPGAGD